MQTFKLILLQNLRRAAIVMGLAMFILFAHKATNEVANTNIAAGNQRQQTLVAASYGAEAINIGGLAGEQSLASQTAAQTNKISEAVSPHGLTDKPSDNKKSLPQGRAQDKPKDRGVSATVNGKSIIVP